MKNNVSYYMLLSVAVALYGCGSSHKAITATPSPCVVTPDSADMVNIDVKFNVPDHYLAKRSRLFITPTLFVGDSAVDEYEPIVLDAPIFSKKTERKKVLNGYVDPYGNVAVRVDNASHPFSVPYSRSLKLPNGIDNGRIMAVVSTDGCGQCTGIDTLDVASVSIPSNLIDVETSFKQSWIKPEFKNRPKVHNGKGEARLQFIVDKWDIVMDLADNRSELTGMLEALRPILEDSLSTLTSLNIFGSASAEGSYAHNVKLAENRANSAKRWLVSKLTLPASVRNIIHIGSRPEGWEPVLQAMIAAGDADSMQVRQLMSKYSGTTDDAAEKYIRRLACWHRIKQHYLAKDRKVLYDYSWTVKSFTDDAELIEMYKKRPDAFSEDEFLRVSELAVDDTSRIDVYKTMMRYFPQSKIGANNLAILYLRAGKENEARKVLAAAGEYTPEMFNTLAASYVDAGDYGNAVEILQNVDKPEARYNLGLMKARQRNMAEAYELLRPFADVNSAICALSVNRNDEANAIMEQVTDNSPLSEYVRSIVAARRGDEAGFINHVVNACSDERLRRRAMTEPEFMRFMSNADFRRIINK